ncbi:MAG: hypothetical protein AAF206_26390 [Bacteroidota bacterium]
MEDRVLQIVPGQTYRIFTTAENAWCHFDGLNSGLLGTTSEYLDAFTLFSVEAEAISINGVPYFPIRCRGGRQDFLHANNLGNHRIDGMTEPMDRYCDFAFMETVPGSGIFNIATAADGLIWHANRGNGNVDTVDAYAQNSEGQEFRYDPFCQFYLKQESL